MFQAEAERLAVPWSIVNPSSVVGDNNCGEFEFELAADSHPTGHWLLARGLRPM